MSVAARDSALTTDRDERKYLLAQAAASGLLRELGRRLTPHRYVGEGANVLPRARHYATTLYFGRAPGLLARSDIFVTTRTR